MKFSDLIKNNRRYLNLVFSGIFLIIVLNMLNTDDVNKLITERANLQNLIGIILVIGSILLIRSIRWVLLIKSLNRNGFPTLQLFYYSFMSQFYNSFLFFGTGDIVKVFSIKFDRSEDKLADIVSMTILDRILDIVIIIVGGFIALVFLEIISLGTLLAIIGIGVFFSLVFAFLVFRSKGYEKLFVKWPAIKEQILLIWSVKATVLLTLLLTIIVWILEGVKIYQITNNLTLSKIVLEDAIFIGLAAWLGTLVLIPISGSLGSKEYLLSRSLKSQGVITSESGLISVFDRFITISISGTIFLCLYIWNKFKGSSMEFKKQKEQPISLKEE